MENCSLWSTACFHYLLEIKPEMNFNQENNEDDGSYYGDFSQKDISLRYAYNLTELQ